MERSRARGTRRAPRTALAAPTPRRSRPGWRWAIPARGGPGGPPDRRRGGGKRPARYRLRRWASGRTGHNRLMKLLRMTPGKGDVLLAEGDPEVAEDEERLVEEFRRQLDLGMWAAVPHEAPGGQPRGDHGPRLLRGPGGCRAGDLLSPGGRRLMGRRYVRNTARERRAEQRARELLRSTAGEEALEIYERFGLLSVERRRVRLSDLSTAPDRRLRRGDRRAAERVLRALPRRLRPRGGGEAPGCRRRARQVDGAARRRARADRDRQRASARAASSTRRWSAAI